VVSSDQKGNIAEAAVVLAALKLGIDVYRPVGEGGRCDLIFSIKDEFLRVQCKWAVLRGERIVIRCYSSRRSGNGLKRRLYEPGEIDAFAAYCEEIDRWYFIPFARFGRRAEINLRLAPTRNNQELGVNWASQYEFKATLRRPGAVAQLGERLAGSQ
jgi:hypothetical protein